MLMFTPSYGTHSDTPLSVWDLMVTCLVDLQVLVDVPCYTDRHVVMEPVNNLFSTSRISERLEMPELQQELL